ncbi:MAG: aconitate hydratase [Spirochaetes bacterium GWF1_51_8]|nr:MAG: aconitate hydratase [Spirochaetes bacterium GWF1_51_8]
MTRDIDMVRKFYAGLRDKVEGAKKALGRPLTLTEKILYSHLAEKPKGELKRGSDYALLNPDRVAMQDVTGQMALLQFMTAGLKKTAVPATVHADHLVEACYGAREDLRNALDNNKEVYSFLESITAKYGIGYWKPGAGIIHQIVLENYAFPGGLMIGTDSHTPNAGGLGMMAVGVGGADAVDVMAGMPWELQMPKIYGVRLKGKLRGWTSPKDIILHLLGLLTVEGGTGAVMEYFGEGTVGLSATGKATVANMGAELGATASLFPFDNKHTEYLNVTGRKDVALMANGLADCLAADSQIYQNPEKYYDKVIEIDLGTLEPYLNGPFTPDKAWPISKMKDAVKENDYPAQLSAALLGSCTNASYEDIDKAAQIAKQVLDKGQKARSKFYISPGSDSVRATVEKEGQLAILKNFGATILANACGPCIGMWNRKDMPMGMANTIVTSFNRNFKKRADGNPATYAFVSTPEILTAMAAAGTLTFDPTKDKISIRYGEEGFMLVPPVPRETPAKFEAAEIGLIEPPADGSGIEVKIDPSSERLQMLEQFPVWDGKDIVDAPVLMKIKGKCTTDHISPAGEWLKYRGHLRNISRNMYLGAVNSFTGEAGKTKSVLSGKEGTPAEIAGEYKENGIGWVVIGDSNIGEGSSREHAAMEPRYLGCLAVIARSFARIHETNLKKQGILALTFADTADYDRIQEGDRLSIPGLNTLAPGRQLTLEIAHSGGGKETVTLNHTFSANQIEWFKAGSALNLIAKAAK